MKKIKAIIGFFCIYMMQLSAYSYDIKALRKWQPAYNRYHYWIGICDFHDKTHPDNSIQRAKIEEWLLSYNHLDSLIVVEDLSSCNAEGRTGCGPYYINSRAGILAGLGNFCNTHNIPVVNVEYRYCRVVGLGPIINNITANPSLFPSAKKMTIADLTSEIEQTYQQLSTNTGNMTFKILMQEKAALIMQEMKKLQLLDKGKKTIADYLLESSTPINRLSVVKNLLTFDGILIGMKLVDATIKAEHKKKIISFGGGTHINEAYEILQKVAGYEPITTSVAPGSPNSLGKNIGATATRYFSKPAPISIELLEHYLKN